MSALTTRQESQITARTELTPDLFLRFVSYIDAQPKTIETYKKALRQLFNYLSLNGIHQPPARGYYSLSRRTQSERAKAQHDSKLYHRFKAFLPMDSTRRDLS